MNANSARKSAKRQLHPKPRHILGAVLTATMEVGEYLFPTSFWITTQGRVFFGSLPTAGSRFTSITTPRTHLPASGHHGIDVRELSGNPAGQPGVCRIAFHQLLIEPFPAQFPDVLFDRCPDKVTAVDGKFRSRSLRLPE